MTDKKLPKMVYVYEQEDRDETYLVAGKTVDDVADQAETRLVGTYVLVSASEVSMRVRKKRVRA